MKQHEAPRFVGCRLASARPFACLGAARSGPSVARAAEEGAL
jgi:hypothetical protein